MSCSIESEHVRLPAPGEETRIPSFEPLIPSPYGVDIDLEVGRRSLGSMASLPPASMVPQQ